MSLKFKEKSSENIQKQIFDEDYKLIPLDIPFPPLGMPIGFPRYNRMVKIKKPVEPPPLAMPGANLPRIVHYMADMGGCGWWRCGAPELLLNYNQKAIINQLTTMVVDPRFYNAGYTAIKLQRQATPVQLEFVKLLKSLGSNRQFRLIYECDDLVFHEDIPMFNRCRTAFTDPVIRKSIEEMIELCDEMLVCSAYMRDYYKSKTKNKKIVYIPNYAPRMWFDRYYDEDRLIKNFDKNRKRPRILATPSGTHFDILNATNQVDDYSHVVQAIIKTRKDFQWVFMGGYPLLLKPYIDNGDIEFINWVNLMGFPKGIYDSNCQVSMAALADNHFNRAKSSIKLQESGYIGLPFVGQDLNPYNDALFKFKTGDDLIDNIKTITKDSALYIKECRKSREISNGYWLDDDSNLNQHLTIYTTAYDDVEKRKQLSPILFKNNY